MSKSNKSKSQKKQVSTKIKSQKIDVRFLRSRTLPSIDDEGGKESRGRVLVIAGSEGMPGAAILSATAALRAGAGKLQVAVPKSAAPWVAMAMPEALVIALPETKNHISPAAAAKAIRQHVKATDAVLIGPGMTGGTALSKFVKLLLPLLKDKIVILDAEAIPCAKKFAKQFTKTGAQVIITPHAGEMASLLDFTKETILKNPSSHAKDFAEKYLVTTILKGACTYIADASGSLMHNLAGNAGLGVSGSGDTLAGIIVGLAAQGADPVTAAAWGVHLHACAGEVLAKKIGPLGYLPREIPLEIPALIAKFSTKSRVR